MFLYFGTLGPCQAPPSMEFSRQEYLSGLPFPSPGDLPHPGIKPRFPSSQAASSPSEPLAKTPYILDTDNPIPGLSWLLSGKESVCGARNAGEPFDPCVGKNPWRRAWQPTPALENLMVRGAWRAIQPIRSQRVRNARRDWAHAQPRFTEQKRFRSLPDGSEIEDAEFQLDTTDSRLFTFWSATLSHKSWPSLVVLCVGACVHAKSL